MALNFEEKEEIRKLVQVATEETIVHTFKVMGVNPDDWDHLQEWRDNYRWVSKYRKLSERVGSAIVVTVMTLLTGAGVAYFLGDRFSGK